MFGVAVAVTLGTLAKESAVAVLGVIAVVELLDWTRARSLVRLAVVLGTSALPLRRICACLRLTAWCGITIWHSFSSRPITSVSALRGMFLFGPVPPGGSVGPLSIMSDGMAAIARMKERPGTSTSVDTTLPMLTPRRASRKQPNRPAGRWSRLMRYNTRVAARVGQHSGNY